MSIENIKKLQLIMDKLQQSLIIEDDDVGDKMFDEAYGAMSELATKQDIETLPGFMDMFILDDMEYTGVCETLINDIFNNFTMEQIIEVLYKKFDILLEKNESRVEDFFISLINTGYFEEFRDMFNTVKSTNSNHFINSFTKGHSKNYSDYILVLRKDMEAWPKK